MPPCPTCHTTAVRLMADPHFATVAKRYPQIRMALCPTCRTAPATHAADDTGSENGYLASESPPVDDGAGDLVPMPSPSPAVPPSGPASFPHGWKDAELVVMIPARSAILYAVLAVAAALLIFHLGSISKTK